MRAERQIADPNRSQATPGLLKFRRFMNEGAPGAHYYVVLLGLQSFDWSQLLRAIEKGLPYGTLDRLRESSAISQDVLLDWLQLAPRTLTRRKEQGRFAPDESDRLLRAARILGKALELFEGDREGAVDWLFTAQPALGGALPADVARTDLGAREVENLIGRLEHGVYS
jgi:putative toxin-antitoxin system antitoxin component (TIGR02293 family)